jgi:signal transduction histidine kinase
MFERYRHLSHALLKYAMQGLLSKDFLLKVSEKIMDSSGADATELWVKEDLHKHFRCSLSGSTKKHFWFKLVPRPLGETLSSSPNESGELSMERLCCKVIRGCVDALHPHVTDRGSFWTNDASTMTVTDEKRVRISTADSLDLSGLNKSLALIPIRIEEECIGLLQLKSAREQFFGTHDLSFFEDISEVLGVALSHQYAQIELRERVKELTCLYGIARVIGQSNASTNEIFQGITELLPPAWLYPEVTCARIVIDGRTHTTEGFRETPFRQKSDIIVEKRNVGFVEVAYLEEKLTLDEGPFLAEERSLIDSVAREVGIFYQRTRADEEKASLHDQLRHADRLATIGQLAAGVAHELNEPLGNILGFAQLAKKTQDLQAQVLRDLQSIETASLHAREIIRKLMAFSRQLPPKKAPVDLNDLVKEGLYYFEARCGKAGIELVLDLAEDLPEITMDAGQMNQALVNLVVNAIQAMPDGGRLKVGTQSIAGGIRLSVEDTGMGMNEELKNQIFLPFFTTKDVDEGTGLGLAVVHGIVNSHGGNIKVDTEETRGTAFHIFLPLESSDEVQRRA